MNIPESIKIAGINYAIKYEEHLNNGTVLSYGHVSYDKALIRIDPNLQSKQGEFRTLLHEMFHAIAYHFDMEIENNENVIDNLAKGLYMVIADNPEMFK